MSELGKALVRAMAHIGGAPKDSRNQQQRYDYTSTETMLSHCRGALRAEGLCVVPLGEAVEHRCEPVQAATKSGSPYTRDMWTVRFEWRLLHESGESVDMSRVMPVESGPGRVLDKAKAAAASMALSYLLRDLLLVPRGEREVEIDARDDSEYVPGGSPDSNPLRAALTRASITPEQWDAWAVAEGRTTGAAMSAQQAQAAAAWVDGEGSAIISGWVQRRGGK